MKLEVDWNQQLDRLKSRLNLSETVLAETIGLSKSMLSQCRAGARPLPLPAKFRLLDRLGYALTRDLMLAALAGESRDAVVEADNRRAMRRAERAMLKHFLESELDQLSPTARGDWYRGLRENFHEAVQIGDAGTLESVLDLSESELFAVERGQARLPFWSRAALLDCGEPSKLIALIESLGLTGLGRSKSSGSAPVQDEASN